MKSDKLHTAIGMVDEDLILRAERKPKNEKTKFLWKWSAVIAAALVIAIGFGIFFGENAPMAMKVYAVCEAEYPEMAPYPNENLPGFAAKYDAWSADRRRQRDYIGKATLSETFLRETAAALLSDAGTENRVYSPLNIYMALAMLAEITEGESRKQILSLLGETDVETLRENAHALWNANYNNDGAVTSILASSLWMNEDVSFRKDTLDTLARSYYASSYQGEMGSDAFDHALQAWLNEQTGGLLKEQISDIAMTPETILALATTIYFQAKWSDEFSESSTKEEIFHGAKGDQTADFMKQTLWYSNYYWGEHYTATYKGIQGSGKMWFILPDEGVSIDELLRDEEALALMTSGTCENKSSIRINLSVPKFDVSSKIDLASKMMELGITDCFDMEKADFSPLLTEDLPVFLSSAEHGARVAIDEEGITAAAYTVMMAAGAAPPPEEEVDFVLDRPFLFVITGMDGSPLFMGAVNQIS